MSKVYDLSEYLSAEPAMIKLGDKLVPIKDGFNDMLKLDALTNRRDTISDVQFFQEFLKITVGEEQAAELINLNMRAKVYKRIMSVIQEAYGGVEDETEDASSNE